MWATVTDVDDVTGETVTERDIRRAASVLETMHGLIGGSERVTLAAGTGSIEIIRDGDEIRARGSFAFPAPGADVELPSWADPSMVTATTTAGMTTTAIPSDAGAFAYPALAFNNGAGQVNLVYLTEAEHGVGAVIRPDIDGRDLYFLKLATCYQVAYMLDNPDLFTRSDVTSVSQDGESAGFRNPDSHLLAPLARKAMRRLSWRSLRLLSPAGGDGTIGRSSVDVNSEAYDNALPWVTM